MDRRVFLSAAGAMPIASMALAAKTVPHSEQTEHFTAGPGDGPIFAGSALVSGPAPEAMMILHPVATGWPSMRSKISYGAGIGYNLFPPAIISGFRRITILMTSLGPFVFAASSQVLVT